MSCAPPYVPMTEEEERESDARLKIIEMEARLQRQLEDRRARKVREANKEQK